MTPRTALLIFGSGVALAFAVVLYARFDYNTYRLPKREYLETRIRYVEGAAEWPNLEAAIVALRYITIKDRPHDGAKLLENLIIEVRPRVGLINGSEAINGTVREEGPPFGIKYAVIVVRQMKIDDACASALHHEFAEHVLPKRSVGNSNPTHALPELTEMSQRMTAECIKRSVAWP